MMVDTGMVRTIAVGAAQVTGRAFPAIAPAIGAVGSFTTGSTTSSNALFSALQRDVAQLIHVAPADLLAGQLAGGNIGNSLAPVLILVGAAAVGARDQISEILRRTLPAALVLLVLTTGLVMVVVALDS
jgi:lactate permease